MELDIMKQQLVQVFEYAELIDRLNKAQEMLNITGGYYGENQLYQEIEKVKIIARQNMDQHLKNSQVSQRAMAIINNYIVSNKTK